VSEDNEIVAQLLILNDAIDELTNGVLADLDLLGREPPAKARKFLRSRPDFEFEQGHVYYLQVGFFPGRAGTLKRDLEALLGQPRPNKTPPPGS
jgi:hypothetical protein